MNPYNLLTFFFSESLPTILEYESPLVHLIVDVVVVFVVVVVAAAVLSSTNIGESFHTVKEAIIPTLLLQPVKRLLHKTQ